MGVRAGLAVPITTARQSIFNASLGSVLDQQSEANAPGQRKSIKTLKWILEHPRLTKTIDNKNDNGNANDTSLLNSAERLDNQTCEKAINAKNDEPLNDAGNSLRENIEVIMKKLEVWMATGDGGAERGGSIGKLGATEFYDFLTRFDQGDAPEGSLFGVQSGTLKELFRQAPFEMERCIKLMDLLERFTVYLKKVILNKNNITKEFISDTKTAGVSKKYSKTLVQMPKIPIHDFPINSANRIPAYPTKPQNPIHSTSRNNLSYKSRASSPTTPNYPHPTTLPRTALIHATARPKIRSSNTFHHPSHPYITLPPNHNSFTKNHTIHPALLPLTLTNLNSSPLDRKKIFVYRILA
jgi:hypothetical protein